MTREPFYLFRNSKTIEFVIIFFFLSFFLFAIDVLIDQLLS